MELQDIEGVWQRNLLETMTPTELCEIRAELLTIISEAEPGVHLINRILEDKGRE